MPSTPSPDRLSPTLGLRAGAEPQENDQAAAPAAVSARKRPARSRSGSPPLAELGSAPVRPQTPDLELAGYLLAREITGRPVGTPTRELLQRANESKKEVLQLMPYGRGNVTTDLEATGNIGFHRLAAVRYLAGSASSLGQPPQRTLATNAGMAVYAGGGNCGEFASVAAHVHAKRMHPGERSVVQGGGSDFDHSWVVLSGRASPGGTTPRVVLDVWGEGPVVDAHDGHFTSPTRGEPLTVQTIDHANATAAHGAFIAATEPNEGTKRRLAKFIDAQAQRQVEPKGTIYAPTPIVAPAFCQEARAAVQARQDDPQLRQAAAALVRQVAPQVDQLPPADEAATVQRVIDHAAQLDAPRARHLIAPTAKRQRTSPSRQVS